MIWQKLILVIRAQDQNSDLQHLLANAGKLLTSSSFVMVIQLLQVALLTRFLLQTGYGLYVSLTAFVLTVNQFFDVRVSETTVRFGSEYRAKGDYVRFAALVKLSYLIDLITGLLGFAVVVVLAKWAAVKFLQDTDLVLGIQLYALTLLISTVDNTSNAILRTTDRFSWVSIYGVAMAIIEFICIATALFFNYGLFGVIIALIVKDLVSASTNLFLARFALRSELPLKNLWRQTPISVLRDRYKTIGMFLLSTNFIAYVRMIATKLDVLILAYFRSPEEVALYKIAMQLAGLVVRVSDSLLSAILPDLSRLWIRGEVARYRDLLKKGSLVTIFILLPLTAFLIVFRVPLIGLMFGEAFISAQGLFSIAIWGFLVAGVTFWTWSAYMSLGYPQVGALVTGIASFIHVLLMLVLTSSFGAIGLAWAFVIIQIGKQLLSVFAINRLTARTMWKQRQIVLED